MHWKSHTWNRDWLINWLCVRVFFYARGGIHAPIAHGANMPEWVSYSISFSVDFCTPKQTVSWGMHVSLNVFIAFQNRAGLRDEAECSYLKWTSKDAVYVFHTLQPLSGFLLPLLNVENSENTKPAPHYSWSNSSLGFRQCARRPF